MASRKRRLDAWDATDPGETRAAARARTGGAGSSTSAPCTTSTLSSLLDFTHLRTHEEISTRFDALAHALLHHFRLRVSADAEYEILELETYLFAPGVHEDPFTHGSDEQRRSGRW